MNEDENTKIKKREKREEQMLAAKERKQAHAEPVEASDERDRLSDDSRGRSEGSETDISEGSDGSGVGEECHICGEKFAKARELIDHYQMHEEDAAEPEESGGKPDDDVD